jgi:hypothetical protein
MDGTTCHEDSGFLTIHRGLSSHSWSQLLRSFPVSKISFPFVFSISSPFYTYLCFPLSFSPSYVPFQLTYLVVFKKSMGSRVGGLEGLLPHPIFYVISLTDRLATLHLAIFSNFVGSRVRAFIIQVPRSPLFTQNSVIHITTITFVVGPEPIKYFSLACKSNQSPFYT